MSSGQGATRPCSFQKPVSMLSASRAALRAARSSGSGMAGSPVRWAVMLEAVPFENLAAWPDVRFVRRRGGFRGHAEVMILSFGYLVLRQLLHLELLTLRGDRANEVEILVLRHQIA